MPKNHVLRDYSRLPDAKLGDFALHIAAMMNGNANFTAPPVTAATLTAQANDYHTALSASIDGTRTDKLDKNTKRAALVAVLDRLANYVELESNNDPAKMLSSGFNLASTLRNAAVPGSPGILSVTNVASGKLGLELQVADGAWCYVVEYTALPDGAVKTVTFTDPHDVTLTGLTPGTLYSLRVMVMGSRNQATDWSDPVQHMAT